MTTKVENAFYERGSWYHRTKSLNADGTTKYGKLGGFETPEEANASYDILNKQYEKDKKDYWLKENNKEMMFKDYMIYWLDEIYSQRIETTTKAIGVYAIYNLIIPNIQYNLKLKQVTTSYLDEIILNASKMTESGGATSRLIIFMAMKDAMLNGFINVNPAINTKTYSRPKPKITILNKEQVKKLLEQAKSTNWYLEVLLGLFCGFRKGEILGLKFSDYDSDSKAISINRQLCNEYEYYEGTNKVKSCKRIEKPPKTDNSYRKIRIPNIIANEIEERKLLIQSIKSKLGDKYNDNDYISCDKDGSSHGLSSLNKALNETCDRACIPRVTVHGLRHMYATILLEQGVSLEKISALLGHSSIHTTYEYYCEVMDEKGKILSYMNDVFSIEESIK